jgi:transposase
MKAGVEALPDDVEALKAALIAARAEAAAARAQQSDDQALIAHLKLQIEKLNRDRHGPRSERTARLLDQLELTLDELESAATEDELAAEIAAAKTSNATTSVASFTRKRPSRQPFPDHLPRERVIVPGPVACSCCGGSRLSRLGEDVTETLEVIPKSWKVIQHVREKFSCRDCEKISQAPAPFHVIARGWAGPSLLAMVLFEKFGQHQPLNRQAERYAKEGVPISLSTLADQVGGCTAVLMPLFKRLEAYVLSAERLHGDDTRVPVLAKGKTDTGRIWLYVRDDKPFGGPAPPGAVFYYSRDRAGKHPQAHLANYTGIFQADAYEGYEGYGKLYEGGRAPGPILEAACWVHTRRPFFVMADLAENARRKAQGKKPAVISPLALAAVRRIDELFEIERAINGQSPEGAKPSDRSSARRWSPIWRAGCVVCCRSTRKGVCYEQLTVWKSCAKDEGGPLGIGFQERTPNQSKLLRSKDVVVSVGSKVRRKFGQVSIRETSASKPSLTRRNALDSVKTRGARILWDKSAGYLVIGQMAAGV